MDAIFGEAKESEKPTKFSSLRKGITAIFMSWSSVDTGRWNTTDNPNKAYARLIRDVWILRDANNSSDGRFDDVGGACDPSKQSTWLPWMYMHSPLFNEENPSNPDPTNVTE